MIWCKLKGTDTKDIVEIPVKYKEYVSLDKEYWFIDYTYKIKIKKIKIVGISATYDPCVERYELLYDVLEKTFLLGWNKDGSYYCDDILNNIFETKQEAVKKLKANK